MFSTTTLKDVNETIQYADPSSLLPHYNVSQSSSSSSSDHDRELKWHDVAFKSNENSNLHSVTVEPDKLFDKFVVHGAIHGTSI